MHECAFVFLLLSTFDSTKIPHRELNQHGKLKNFLSMSMTVAQKSQRLPYILTTYCLFFGSIHIAHISLTLSISPSLVILEWHSMQCILTVNKHLNSRLLRVRACYLPSICIVCLVTIHMLPIAYFRRININETQNYYGDSK